MRENSCLCMTISNCSSKATEAQLTTPAVIHAIIKAPELTSEGTQYFFTWNNL